MPTDTSRARQRPAAPGRRRRSSRWKTKQRARPSSRRSASSTWTPRRGCSGQDMWTLPPLPEIGLRLPRHVRRPDRRPRACAGPPTTRPSRCPRPTALAATWDPELARRAGALLAQEARRKGVHVLLAPTVNLHRSPLGGRHFEAYSEDPYLTGAIGYRLRDAACRTAASAPPSSTSSPTTPRPTASPWTTSCRRTRPARAVPGPLRGDRRERPPLGHHDRLQRGQRHDDDRAPPPAERESCAASGASTASSSPTGWPPARRRRRHPGRPRRRHARPGRPSTASRSPQAVRDGEVDEAEVDEAVRRVLRLAARVGILEGADPAVTEPPAAGRRRGPGPRDRPPLLRPASATTSAALPLPTAPAGARSPSSAPAARDARVLGGGSATVFPAHVVSPLDGLTRRPARGHAELRRRRRPERRTRPSPTRGSTLRAVCRDADGRVLGASSAAQRPAPVDGHDLPEGVDPRRRSHTVELTGTFTPRESRPAHLRHQGPRRLHPDRRRHDALRRRPAHRRATTRSRRSSAPRCTAPRSSSTAGAPVEVSLRLRRPTARRGLPSQAVAFSLAHREPAARPRRADRRGRRGRPRRRHRRRRRRHHRTRRVRGLRPHRPRASPAARTSWSRARRRRQPAHRRGRQRRLPGGAAVARRGRRGAAELVPRPGGAAPPSPTCSPAPHEPGGRLPTTWPAPLEDAPVTQVTPTDGELPYDEGVFIGYRAWEQAGRDAPRTPSATASATPTWTYESRRASDRRRPSRSGVRNTGPAAGREVVQVYLAPATATRCPARPRAGRLRDRGGGRRARPSTATRHPAAARVRDLGRDEPEVGLPPRRVHPAGRPLLRRLPPHPAHRSGRLTAQLSSTARNRAGPPSLAVGRPVDHSQSTVPHGGRPGMVAKCPATEPAV